MRIVRHEVDSTNETDDCRQKTVIETLEWQLEFSRRSIDTLAKKLREMTAAYHELLEREERAVDGIAYAMLERPVDMGLSEYVEAISEYCSHLRAERDQHLGSLPKASVKI